MSEDAKNAEHNARMKEVKAEQDARVRSKEVKKKGLLIINTGNGKGKSTSGFGLTMRALGHDINVAVIQFIKGKWSTGEQRLFAKLKGDAFAKTEWVIAGEGFTWETQNRAQDMAVAKRGFDRAVELMALREEDGSPTFPVILLDELNIVLQYDYLPADVVVEAMNARHPMQHVCITGRGAPQALIDIADTVTEMTPIKHAFESGIRAQLGIEF